MPVLSVGGRFENNEKSGNNIKNCITKGMTNLKEREKCFEFPSPFSPVISMRGSVYSYHLMPKENRCSRKVNTLGERILQLQHQPILVI